MCLRGSERSLQNLFLYFSHLRLLYFIYDDSIRILMQTSGGLLAAVPAHFAENLIHSLHVAGYPSAAVIGKVVKRKSQDILVILNK